MRMRDPFCSAGSCVVRRPPRGSYSGGSRCHATHETSAYHVGLSGRDDSMARGAERAAAPIMYWPAGYQATRLGPARSRGENLVASITVDDFFNDLDSEARARRRIDPPVNVIEWFGNKIMLHGISQRLQLEELACR